MVNKGIIILVILSGILPFNVNAQQESTVSFPQVGDYIEEYVLTDTENFREDTINITDFRGKWLIIDFWGRGCAGCIASFPKMNKLHLRFKDSVQILMVGLYDGSRETDHLTKDVYSRMKSIHDLKFVVAFDTLGWKKFDIWTFPTILVVNPKGIIVAKTTGVDEEQIAELLKGKIPLFRRQFSLHEKREFGIDRSMPLLTNGTPANGGVDTAFLFRSLLAQYSPSTPLRLSSLNGGRGKEVIETGRLEVCGFSLKKLYFLAYFGKHSWTFNNPLYGHYSQDIVLDIDDTTEFIADKKTSKGLYCYSLIVPPKKSSKERLKKIMQSDLNNFFEYKARIENRKMPAYHLIVIDSAKARTLRSSGEKSSYSYPFGTKYFGFLAINRELGGDIMSSLLICLPRGTSHLPLIDKTGINYNVDLKLEADMLSFDSVNNQLANVGLRIIKTTEEMKTLVIRE